MNPRLHPLATLHVGGYRSGCQGCDAATPAPTSADPVRLCNECAWRLPGDTAASGALEALWRIRRSLGLNAPSPQDNHGDFR